MTKELFRLTASEVVALTKSGAVSVEQYAESLLARVAARDPVVHGWAYINPDLVRQQARELDSIPASERGPLHGVAIGVKDVILTKDQPTQYHSVIYEGNAPAIDAGPIITLRKAGALIFGKTHTTEFAAVTAGGPCCNPHDLSRTPGGSSSGSGAVVGDFQVPIALGTQTGGSVIRPGAYNGIFALKPTWNSLSREGLAQYSLTCDTLGFYSRSVEDMNLLADIFKLQDDVEIPTAPFDIKGAKIGVCKTFQWGHAGPGTIAAMQKAAELLTAAGATVEQVDLPEDFAKVEQWHDDVLAGEARVSFLGVYRTNKEALDPFIVERVERPITAFTRKQQLAALDGTARLRPVIDDIAGQYDAILTPSVIDEAPVGLESTGVAIFNLCWTILHVPVLNIPGFKGQNNMPISLSLLAPRYNDRHLLHVGEAVGEVFAQGGWKPSV